MRTLYQLSVIYLNNFKKKKNISQPKEKKKMSTQILTNKIKLENNKYSRHIDIKNQYAKFLGTTKIHAISKEPNSTSPKVIDNTQTPNGFVSAFLQAYNKHQHLKISPDDVWITIAQGVSHHINFNSEKYRCMFVEHEGKKDVIIDVIGILRFTNDSIEGDWNQATQLLTDATDKEVKKMELKELLECNFTTTTPITKTSSNIVLLDTVKAYFSYTMMLGCGIPKITLTGTLEDWAKIQEKLVELRKLNLDLDFWLDRLDPVILQFISTYKGEVDEDFWSRIFTYESFGSGRQKGLTGWMTAFFPYTRDGEPLGGYVNLKDLPYGRVSVPFVAKDDFVTLNLQLITGFIGCKREVVDQEDIVSPVISWAIADAKEVESSEQ